MHCDHSFLLQKQNPDCLFRFSCLKLLEESVDTTSKKRVFFLQDLEHLAQTFQSGSDKRCRQSAKKFMAKYVTGKANALVQSRVQIQALGVSFNTTPTPTGNTFALNSLSNFMVNETEL